MYSWRRVSCCSMVCACCWRWVETRTYIAISIVFLLWVLSGRSGLCRFGCPLEKELVDGIPALLGIWPCDCGALNVPLLCHISSCQRRCCDRRIEELVRCVMRAGDVPSALARTFNPARHAKFVIYDNTYANR